MERKEWLTTGSSHLFKMIRRRLPKHCLLDPADHEWQHAQITGWLPAHKSNFFTGILELFFFVLSRLVCACACAASTTGFAC